MVLKSISLVYKRNLQQSNEWVNSDKAFELFRQLSGFIALLQPRGNDTKSALILTFDWITKWAEMRRCASGSQEEEIDLMALKRKVVAAVTFLLDFLKFNCQFVKLEYGVNFEFLNLYIISYKS